MNEFVNFRKRSIELPAGCKDLIDVLPPPREARMPAEGFAHIEHYLTLLLQPASKRKSVMIWSGDYQEQVLVSSRDGALKMIVLVDTHNADREQAVLRLFRQAGISAVRDEDGRESGVPLRVLIYPLPPTASAAAILIRALLQTVYGLTDGAGLLFQYHERDAPNR